MILRTIRTAAILFFMSSFFVFANAAAPQWKIDRNKSEITFSATQNNSPISGQFTLFTGDIFFDPTELKTSHVKITVSTGSVSTSYKQVELTLKTADWFNVKLFKDAVFEANQFVKVKDNQFLAKGTLTLRDKTVPVTLNFSLEDYSKTKARVTGSTTIKRTDFGVGQGEWSKTDAVKDNVGIQFKITATRE